VAHASNNRTTSLHLLFVLNLLSDFFLDLFKGFKEELLYFRSLVDDNLTESSDVAEFTVLYTEVLFSVNNILFLLLNH
jgi:hypothetical protein